MQEINKHMPTFEHLIQYYANQNSKIHFVIYKAPGISANVFHNYQDYKNVTIASTSILASFNLLLGRSLSIDSLSSNLFN